MKHISTRERTFRRTVGLAAFLTPIYILISAVLGVWYITEHMEMLVSAAAVALLFSCVIGFVVALIHRRIALWMFNRWLDTWRHQRHSPYFAPLKRYYHKLY